ncbi:MAG: hypothetical protein JXB88_13530 [Spirochaetales bacterium]|nr:hypothetical protein [Spirochaetales bacterium]
MITSTRKILYPEGDRREIPHTLKINQLVDLNGNPLELPLQTAKMIVYRVCKITMQSTRNENITNYHLELMNRIDLSQYIKNGVFL